MSVLFKERPRAHAIIVQNRNGGWSLILPSAGIPLGNYATPQDASAVALINGYEPEVHS